MARSTPCAPVMRIPGGVTLVGGGTVSGAALVAARAFAPRLVAADGGADAALRLGHRPEAAIGDFDSISPEARATLGAGALHHVAEQDSTDFDKALRLVAAEFTVAVGFGGARADHTLAAFNVLARYPDRRCLLLSDADVAFLAPRALRLALSPGTRLSLFPMAPVMAWAEGVRWPVAGQEFTPAGLVGTSNEVTAPQVALQFSAAAMLVILPADCLGAALAGLGCAPARPAR
jgi:thiamine pyrophosphokinase